MNPDPAAQGAARSRDGFQIALLSSRLDGVVRAMSNTLFRTARSTVLNTAKDFSISLLTADGRVISMVESLPLHVLSGGEEQVAALNELHPELRPGDAFLNNSPYHGNSHAADWTVLVPIFSAGVHRFTAFVKAHLADCGNSIPTTYMVSAKDVYEEGALIFPCVKVQSAYSDNQDLIRMAQMRIRVPDMWYGDYRAMIGAARVGERKLQALMEEYGADELDAYVEDWLDYSEQQMREIIRRTPSAELRTSGRHDPIPGILDDGIEIQTTTTVDAKAETITVDLRDNPDCLPCGINLTRSTATSAALAGVFAGLNAAVPVNAGSLRPVRVLLRENCVVGIPVHPHSASVSTSNLTEVIAESVTRSFADLGDGFGTAEFGKVQPASFAVISGRDARRNHAPFVNQFFLAATGGAASPTADGWLTATCVTVAGSLHQDSVEIDEMKYPIVVREQRLIPDSEGAGRRRGSPAARVEYGPVDTAITVAFLSDGTYTPPRGVRGGEDATTASQRVRDRDGSLSAEIGVAGLVDLAPGESMVSVATGGGGYGSPAEREPARVLEDVLEGLVSRERAEKVYRVSISAAGEVDDAKTAVLRSGAATRGPGAR